MTLERGKCFTSISHSCHAVSTHGVCHKRMKVLKLTVNILTVLPKHCRMSGNCHGSTRCTNSVRNCPRVETRKIVNAFLHSLQNRHWRADDAFCAYGVLKRRWQCLHKWCPESKILQLRKMDKPASVESLGWTGLVLRRSNRWYLRYQQKPRMPEHKV